MSRPALLLYSGVVSPGRKPEAPWVAYIRAMCPVLGRISARLRQENQPMSRRTLGWSILLILGLLVVTGCSRSPEARKTRHLERGEKYAAQEQYREAGLEYRNVLRVDPANEQAIRQLGLWYFQLGELGEAFRYLLKAEELAPDALDVR